MSVAVIRVRKSWTRLAVLNISIAWKEVMVCTRLVRIEIDCEIVSYEYFVLMTREGNDISITGIMILHL